MGYYKGYIGYIGNTLNILGLNKDNGKENGNYYSIIPNMTRHP